MFFESKHHHVGLNYKLVVLLGLFPSLDVNSQSLEPLALHFEEFVPHIAEDHSLQLVFGESLGQDVQPYLRIHSVAVAQPGFPGFSQLVGVATPDKFLDALMAELGVLHIVSPHLEGSLHFFAAVFSLDVPDRL